MSYFAKLLIGSAISVDRGPWTVDCGLWTIPQIAREGELLNLVNNVPKIPKLLQNLRPLLRFLATRAIPLPASPCIHKLILLVFCSTCGRWKSGDQMRRWLRGGGGTKVHGGGTRIG
jgi:hypothetical protein